MTSSSVGVRFGKGKEVVLPIEAGSVHQVTDQEAGAMRSAAASGKIRWSGKGEVAALWPSPGCCGSTGRVWNDSGACVRLERPI